MKTTKILLSLALATAALMGCKEPKLQPISNSAYINEASSSNSKAVAADNAGAKATLVARIATAENKDVTFEWAVNAAYIDQYNKVNGTVYKMLPKEYFSLGKTLDTIKAGFVNPAAPLVINIGSIADLPTDVKYAIPVSMTSIKGATPMVSSVDILVTISRVIETRVIKLNGGYFKCAFAEALKQKNVRNWTAEFLFKPTNVETNNQALFMAYPDEVYSRLGDQKNAAPDEMQVKTQGQQPKTLSKFIKDKWHHVAFVYDGAKISIIINGKTDVVFPSPTANFGYQFNEAQFGNENTTCQVAEVRFWTITRTNAQLIDTQYAVSPTSEGLLFYWKCDEGTGNAIKDYTGHGYDAVANGSPTWIDNVRFPDNK